MVTEERIRGRQVSIEVVGVVPDGGWMGSGVVKEDSATKKGPRFEARATDPGEAERRLKLAIKAAFA
jgi:hypothetical protein